MSPDTFLLIQDFIDEHLAEFHSKLVNKLTNLKLTNILKRKNPYLFKARNLENAGDFIKAIVGAYVSSAEEAVFGEFLEKLAIHVCSQAFNGIKSGAEGIDLEFEREDIRYFVTIKSGPHWGNSGQIKRMVSNFNQIRKILSPNNLELVWKVFCKGCQTYGDQSGPT